MGGMYRTKHLHVGWGKGVLGWGGCSRSIKYTEQFKFVAFTLEITPAYCLLLFREEDLDICWIDKILEKWDKLKLLVLIVFLSFKNAIWTFLV